MFAEANLLPPEEKVILVADDEVSICRLLQRFFTKEGYRVLTSFNGQEAMEIVRKEPIALAILDIQMPEMTGLEALQELRERGIEIPVIIMTGQCSPASLEEARRFHSFAYLLKPFELEELRRLVSEAVG